MSRFFGKAEHLGFVVPDLDEAIARLVAAGIGPVYTMRRIRVAARYRGQRHDPLISTAIVYSGSLQMEFICQHDATPSVYADFIASNPGGGLQHAAHYCEGFDAALAGASARGQDFTVMQEFIDPASGAAFEIYVEPLGASGAIQAQLMFHGPFDALYAEMEAAAASWDGSNPERSMLAMLPAGMAPPQEPA